jgi:cystathionine beta-lyase
MRENTKAVYLESPGSLTFEVQDLPSIAAAAHGRGATVVVDNTWATPLFHKAHALGADLVVMAATKYIVGHSDAMFGTVSAASGSLHRLKAFHGEMGLCAGPDDMYLAARGVRTLAVRLRRHEESAIAVARYLQDRPEVRRVMHPALETDAGHALWKRDFLGASGLFSVVLEPGTDRQVAAFLDGLKLFGLGYSWGGFESLAIPFDARRYRTATSFEAEGPTVRFHIGLEDVEDLVADLASGLDRFRAAA